MQKHSKISYAIEIGGLHKLPAYQIDSILYCQLEMVEQIRHGFK